MFYFLLNYKFWLYSIISIVILIATLSVYFKIIFKDVTSPKIAKSSLKILCKKYEKLNKEYEKFKISGLDNYDNFPKKYCPELTHSQSSEKLAQDKIKYSEEVKNFRLEEIIKAWPKKRIEKILRQNARIMVVKKESIKILSRYYQKLKIFFDAYSDENYYEQTLDSDLPSDMKEMLLKISQDFAKPAGDLLLHIIYFLRSLDEVVCSDEDIFDICYARETAPKVVARRKINHYK